MNSAYAHTTNTDYIVDGIDEDGIIPFADDCEVTKALGEAVDTDDIVSDTPRDSAIDAFGPIEPKRLSVADRELGIERGKWERRGKYTCPCCSHATSRVVRVRVASQPRWSAVCAVCAAALLSEIPGTIVGGMVRPTRRKRSVKPGKIAHGFRRLASIGYRRAG